ncbi:MAG: adenylate kinase family protein [Candidatus Aenigmatarchaeota archaeon]
MIIAVSGTPGTGKSKASKLLAKKIKYKRLDLNRVIKKHKLYSFYDRSRKTYVADLRKVREFVSNLVKEEPNLVIDSHISHELKADIVIVLRCKPDVLAKRLKKKRWSRAKIEENKEAEFIGIISHEARKKHKKVWEINTTSADAQEVARKMENIFKGRGRKYTRVIDWLE